MIFRTELRTLAPVAISIRRATGNSLASQQHVPGTTFRGALAAAYLECGGVVTDEAFEFIFVKQKARFTDLRVNGSARWPRSARKCKQDEEHARVDLLLAAGGGQPLLRPCRQCEGQDGKLVPITGFVRWKNQDKEWGTDRIQMERRQHTAIDPRTLRAAISQFHSSTVIAKDQLFEGRIYCPDDQERLLTAIMDTGRRLTLGRGGSRGHGATEFCYQKWPGSTVEEMAERLRRLNKAAGRGGEAVFSLTLQAPALFLDEWLLPKLDVRGADLHTGLAAYNALAAFTAEEVQTGWHSAAALPKREEWMLAAGSAILFGAKVGDVEREIERIAPILAALEEQGCGERLAEGFGEVECCSPIHVDLAEEDV